MTSRRDRITALLLSVMMIALNLFSGTEALYAYADNDADSQTITEETADTEQAEDTADAEEEEQAETPKEEAAPAEEAAQEEAAPVEEAEEEAEEEVAFSDEETLDGVTIKVTADEGVFPEGAELEVRDLTAKEEKDAKKAIDEITDEKADTEYLFDISVQKDGKEIEPEGDVKVSFETEEIANDAFEAEVFHIEKDEAEKLSVETKGEVATIETDSFSPYSLRLIYRDPDDSSLDGEYELAITSTWTDLNSVLHGLGNAFAEYSVISARSMNEAVIKVRQFEDVWQVRGVDGDEGNSHGLELAISNGVKTKEINLNVATHTHVWDLTTSEDKTTATLKCTNTNCVWGKDTEYTAVAASNTVTYDGNTHGASLSTNTMPSDVTITGPEYYKGTSLLGSAPKNAGTYRAVWTVTPHSNNLSSKTIETTVTINKADINITTAPVGYTNLVYDGTNQNLHTSGSAKSAATTETFDILFADGSVTNKDLFSTSHIKKRDAGTYTISYYVKDPNGNHNDTAISTFSATINKRPVAISGITAYDKVYDGTDTAHLNTSGIHFAEGDKIAGDNLTPSATGTYRTIWSEEPEPAILVAGKDVGTNKIIDIKYTIDGTSVNNYRIDTLNSQATTNASITKKNIEVSWDNATALQYTGDYQAPTPDLAFAEKDPETGKEIIDASDLRIYAVDKGKVSATLAVGSAKKNVGGIYKAYVGELTGTEAKNYNLIHRDTPSEFTIIPKKLTATWTETTQEYNAKGLKPTVALTGFVYDEGELVKPIADTLTIEAVAPTSLVGGEAYNAGNYKASIELADATEVEAENSVLGNYEITNPTVDFTITKAPLTVRAAGWIYYGDKVSSNDDINDLQYSGIVGLKGEDGAEVLTAIEQGTSVRFETNYNFLDNATGVNGARYYLIPEFEEAANYTVTNDDGELTVYPKPVTLAWTHTHNGETESAIANPEQVYRFTYDGKKHTYTAEVTDDSYVKIDGKPYIPERIVVTLAANIQRDANANNGPEQYKALATDLSNPNYSLKEVIPETNRTKKDIDTVGVNFFIDQLPIELSWKPAEFTYNAQSQRPTATIENLQTDDNGKKDDEFEITFTPAPAESINADNYTATVTDLADKNYSELATPTDPESALVPTGTFAYTIKKAPLSIKSIAKTITYRDEAPEASEYELDVAGAGLQGDDTIESIGLDTRSLEFSCSYRKNDKPGSYAVVPSLDEQTPANYTVVLKDGTLQVNDKSLGLVAKGIAKGKKKGALAWNGVTGATSYEVWMAPCSSKSFKRVATVGGTSYVTKKLKKNKFYKFYIVANTPYGRIYSSESHFCTGNKAKKLTNAKSLKINAGSVGLNKGDSFTIGKSAKKAKKKLKFPGAKHGGNFRFMSDNPEVATVNGAGTITAVGSGWCRVYTQTTNGIWQVTEVYVY